MLDFKTKNKIFGDWCIQFGIALVAGAIVSIAANVWVGGYAFIIGVIVFFVGNKYKYGKRHH